jgi:hypothetical protein|tara:strand:+ start:3837 stop:4004 length:168 start_codon:yes stop_codon:yes gene_type:complete
MVGDARGVGEGSVMREGAIGRDAREERREERLVERLTTRATRRERDQRGGEVSLE